MIFKGGHPPPTVFIGFSILAFSACAKYYILVHTLTSMRTVPVFHY